MRPIERPAFAAVLSSVLLAGCAARGGWFGPDELGPPFSDPELTVPAAALLVRQGESRKAEVIDRLGPAQVLRFDSGYEAWVYRSRGRARRAGHARTGAAVRSVGGAGPAARAAGVWGGR